MQTIKWGILGTSYISEVMAKAITESLMGQVVAIGSRSRNKAQKFCEKFSIQKAYGSYHDLLNDDAIDAVYIGLPNHLHKDWIIHCARAHKNILCEKPFVINIKEAHDVISVIKKTHVLCMEAFMYRYHPYITKLMEIVQNKTIGDIKLYHAIYTAPIANFANPIAGGSIRNLGCYPISLIRLLANKEPIEIAGTGRISSENKTDRQASVILKFQNDAIANVATADDMEMVWQFDVYGTKGMLKTQNNPWLPNCDNNKISLYLNEQKTNREINVTAEKSLYTYQIDFLNFNIINNTDHKKFNEDTLSASLGNITVLETWLQQIKEGSVINHQSFHNLYSR